MRGKKKGAISSRREACSAFKERGKKKMQKKGKERAVVSVPSQAKKGGKKTGWPPLAARRKREGLTVEKEERGHGPRRITQTGGKWGCGEKKTITQNDQRWRREKRG